MAKRIPTRTRMEKYEAGNRAAAEVILADPERYAGIQVIWAQMFMARDSSAHPRSSQMVERRLTDPGEADQQLLSVDEQKGIYEEAN